MYLIHNKKHPHNDRDHIPAEQTLKVWDETKGKWIEKIFQSTRIIIKTDGRKCQFLTKCLGVVTSVREKLSVKYPIFKRSHRGGGKMKFETKCYFDSRDWTFPMGFLKEVLSCMKELDYSTQVLSTIPMRFEGEILESWGGGTIDYNTQESSERKFILRDYQIQAVKLALNNHLGVLDLATNAGKTMIALFCMLNCVLSGKRALFVCNSKEILEQTVKTAIEFFGEKNIGQWSGSSKELAPVMFCTVQSLNKLTKPIPDVGLVMIDELHLFVNPSGKRLLMFYYHAKVIGMSGSAFVGEDHRKMSTQALFGRPLMTVKNDELVKKGVSANGKIYMVDIDVPNPLPKALIERMKKEPEGADAVEMDNYCYSNNTPRNHILKKLAINQYNQDRRIVMLVKRIEHGENLMAMIEPILKDKVAFLQGEDSRKRRDYIFDKFKSGEIRVIIATTILDTGVSINEIDTIINCCGGSSKSKVLQRLGRILRKKEVEFRFFDTMEKYNSFVHRQSKTRLSVYKDLKTFPVISIDTDKLKTLYK